MKNKDKSYTPIDKGQFSLETDQRVLEFEKKRGYGNIEEYEEYRKKWKNFPKNKILNDYPLHVDIELASICNLRCPMCYTISPEFRKKVNAKLMEWDLFTKIVDECSKAKIFSVRLSFRGEAFLHPKFVECVKYCKSKGIKEVSSLTNGLRLDEKMFEELCDAGMDWITISFDGLDKTYEKIRYPAKFKRAIEKIKNYHLIKKKKKIIKPVIKIQSILPVIEDCMDEFYDVFKDITDMVSSNPLIDFHQSTSDLPKIENFSCPQIYQRLVIGADGLCMMCANDEVGREIVGDMNKETIKQIWNNKRFTEIRDIHSKSQGSKKLKPCAECYLPLKTKKVEIGIGVRSVSAEKYISGIEDLNKLNTPDRWKKLI